MRGALAEEQDADGDLRIIPTDAGNTEDEGDQWRIHEDHPRGCGEHHCPPAIPIRREGSSPRMRGAQLHD